MHTGTLAFSAIVREEDIPTAGIRHITEADIRWAEERNMTCKQIMGSRRQGDSISVYVEPAFLHADMLEANLPIRSSIAILEGKYVGRLGFFGAGAGTLPTGMNMMQDVMDILHQVGRLHCFTEPSRVDNSLLQHTYYIRGEADIPEAQERGDGWLLTKPLPVAQMHAMAREAEKAGHPLFFASIAQE